MALSKGVTLSEVCSLLYRFPYGRSFLFLTSLKLSLAPASVEHPQPPAWEWKLLRWLEPALAWWFCNLAPLTPYMHPVRKSPSSHHTNERKQAAPLRGSHSLPCCGLSSPFLSPCQRGWMSKPTKQMANQCEKVPKTNLTSRRQALGAVFAYGGRLMVFAPSRYIISFSQSYLIPGLIYILNEVGWFLINPEGFILVQFHLSVAYLCPQL